MKIEKADPLLDEVFRPLKPVYEDRKSYYGRAEVQVKDPLGKPCNQLYSYGRYIASERETVNGHVRISLHPSLGHGGPMFSRTTGRHFKEWLLQAGVDMGKLMEEYHAKGLTDLIVRKVKGGELLAPLS